MKKIFFLALGLSLLGTAEAQIKTPAASPATTISQTVGLTKFELNYSRPSLRGREMYKEIIQLREVWRFGANKNTTISFDTEVVVQGQTVKPGVYAMFAIPHEGVWEFLFYTDTDNWGAPEKIDDKKIAARIKVEEVRIKERVETFTISFGDLSSYYEFNLNVSWGNSLFPIKFELPTHKLTVASINETLSKKNPEGSDYYRAGVYYLSSETDFRLAAEYLGKAVDLSGGDKAPMYYHFNYADALAKAGAKKEALSAAERALKVSEQAKSEEYIRKSERLIQSLKK